MQSLVQMAPSEDYSSTIISAVEVRECQTTMTMNMVPDMEDLQRG